MKTRLIQTAAIALDGTILNSLSVHDYQSDTAGNAVDGGLEYQKRNGAFKNDLSLYTSDPLNEICEFILFDIELDNKKPPRWKLGKECDLAELMCANQKLKDLFPNGGGYVISIKLACLNLLALERSGR